MIKIHNALIILICSILLNNISLYSQEDGESSFYDRKSSIGLIKEIFAADSIKYMIQSDFLYKELSTQTNALKVYLYDFKADFSKSDLKKINGKSLYSYIEYDYEYEILYNNGEGNVNVFGRVLRSPNSISMGKLLEPYNQNTHGVAANNLSAIIYEIRKIARWDLEKVRVIHIQGLFPIFLTVYNDIIYAIKDGKLILMSENINYLIENFDDKYK